jgi:choline dehydrogenase-like flavoprotein
MFAGVGGSSLLYGAQWMRLLPSDFRVKTLDGVADDWPIDYYELAPYYDRVDKFLGVSGLGGDPAYPPFDFDMPPHPLGKGGMRMAGAMNRLGWHWWPGTQAIPTWPHKGMAKCVRWGVCETGCPAGAKASFDLGYWPHATSAGAKLRTGARVREITIDRHARANGVIWIDRDGVEHHQRARTVIMAANGIGTPRLLLLSRSAQFPDGLANRSGLVGKNLMLHPNNEVLGLYDEDIESWQGPAGQLMYSLEFYESDRSRGFLHSSGPHTGPRGRARSTR